MSQIQPGTRIKPVYAMATPNAEVELWHGVTALTLGGTKHNGEGTLLLSRIPLPRILCRFERKPPPANISMFGESILDIAGASGPVSAGLIDMPELSPNSLTAEVVAREPITLGAKGPVQHIRFHLTNFPRFTGKSAAEQAQEQNINPLNRLIFDAGDYRIAIDSVEAYNELARIWRQTGGYFISHAGILERIDGTDLQLNEGLEVLKGVAHFLMFLSGRPVAIELPSGYDAAGTKVWELLQAAEETSPYRPNNWAKHSVASEMVKLFPGFWRKWVDSQWTESLVLIINWYLQALANPKPADASIAILQTSLEILGWTIVIETEGVLSKAGYDKLEASDKIRLMLRECGIPLKLDPSLVELGKAAAALNWSDGPAALTALRNRIIHPEAKQRDQIYQKYPQSRPEGLELALWYLELSMLASFDYKDFYWDRLEADDQMDNKRAPWIK